MPVIQLPANGWRPRPYQRPLWRYLENGGRHAVAVWHRRAGKDEIALHRTAIAAHERPGNYWHMLPQYAMARKAIWDAINPHSGKRRIDEAFPPALRKSTSAHEMKIEFHCGAIWQVVGSDNFNSLIGSPPVGIVYSEWAVADPLAQGYLSPILAENGGWSLYIYTARGYNHGYRTYQSAKKMPGSFSELLTVEDTSAIPLDVVHGLKQQYMDTYGEDAGESLWRQEFWNDWSAANIGAVLGKEIERADKDGRIGEVPYDPEFGVEWSCDIGFRDTCSWWAWQRKYGGFSLVDYKQGTGMDADDWIGELQKLPYKIDKIHLPHDARVKTFQSKHSAVERFLLAFGPSVINVVPQVKISDRINAARRVAKFCEFDATKCEKGLDGLRSWSFDFDEEKRIYSSEPRHDWASHPGDGYSYGAQIMEERVMPDKDDEEPKFWHQQTINELWESAERHKGRERY